MNIAILYSLPTKRAVKTSYLASDEDTALSAKKIFDALLEKKQNPFLFPITEDSIPTIRTITADCIVNLIEWTGPDFPLSIAAMERLTSLGIPFTGADATNYTMTTDKVRMKEALDANNLPTARWQEFVTGNENIRPDFHYPVIVKESLEHCSIGLSHDAVAQNENGLRKVVQKNLKKFEQPILAEEFIIGREFQVTVLDRPTGLTVLPAAEIFFTSPTGFLTYGSRWEMSHPDYQTTSITLASLAPPLQKRIETIALASFRKLGFTDYSRLDIRVRDDEIFILEANSNPGLGDDPEYDMTLAYKAIGLSFSDFVWEIVESCLRRFAIKH